MQIADINYRNFRSIASASLDDCRQLNILIGQNNSGKSNLLKGVTTFFAHLAPESLIEIVSNNSHKRDLYVNGTDTTKTASIEVTFTLNRDDHRRLISDLAQEAPQLRNALDELDATLRLQVTQQITLQPAAIHVKRITLISPDKSTEKILLDVGPDSFAELHARALAEKSVIADIAAIEAIRDEYAEQDRIGNTGDDRTYVRRYLMRHVSSTQSDLLRGEVLSILDQNSSHAATIASLTDLAAQRQELLAQHRSDLLSKSIDTFAGQANTIPKYVINLLSAIKAMKVLYLDETRKPVGEEEARRLLSLKMRRGGSSELQAIQSTVSGLLGVQIDAFESAQTAPVRPGSAARRSLAEMDVDNFLVQVNGSGIREALRLILDVQFENPHVLLLEEPEVHLHPALEYNLLQYLKQQSEQRQVFLTTHSTNFLDTAEYSNVYLVQKTLSSRVQRMAIDDLEEEIPRELGIRLSSVFMFDRLVFVEGPSDEMVLREIAFKLGINIAQHNVGFVQMGGARGFAQYVNAAVIDTLTKRNVKLYFVIDKDERAQDELAKMAKACHGKAELHVFEKRELENYLINARAISAVVTKKTQGKLQPEPADIEELIESAADELKSSTIARHALQQGCRSLLFDRTGLSGVTEEDFTERAVQAFNHMSDELSGMRSEIGDVITTIKADIDQKWDREKLSLTPGADLLDVVFRKFGVRYRKDRDATALVRPMKTEDIASELVNLLRRIVGY